MPATAVTSSRQTGERPPPPGRPPRGGRPGGAGRAAPAVATLGLVVEEVDTDFCGEIVAVDRDLGTLTLEDRRGRRRGFPLGPGFLLEGRPVVLGAPVTRSAPARSRRTASGSVAV